MEVYGSFSYTGGKFEFGEKSSEGGMCNYALFLGELWVGHLIM